MARAVGGARQPGGAGRVQIGWQLAAIDGKPVDSDFRSSLDHDSALRFVDEAGRTRALSLRGAMLAPEPERRMRRLPGDILLLVIDVFEPGLERWVADAIAEEPPAAVILDLRENEGGEADAIARVAGRFFLEKRTLLRRTRRDGFEDVPIAGAGRRAFAGPLAVLVGPRSASGAEAIAAMIEEAGRGITVGERTLGGFDRRLGGGSARRRPPVGGRVRHPHAERSADRRPGLHPAHVVRPTLADLRAGRDPTLDKAMALLAAE